MFDGSYLGLSTSFQKGAKDKAFLINGKDIMETRQCTVRHAHYANIILQPLERRLKTILYSIQKHIYIYQIVIMSFRFIFLLFVYFIHIYGGDKESLLHPK